MAKRKPAPPPAGDLAEASSLPLRLAHPPAAPPADAPPRRPPVHTSAPAPSDDDLLDALCQYLAGQLPHVADEIRAAMADQRRVWGGQAVYIRSAAPEQRAQQRREFLAAFNGANKRELMRRFGISRATAQRWIEAYYRERRRESAHALP